MTDLYTILDVSRDAGPGEIKRAYRRKAKEHHPDTGGDPEVFMAVARAYAVLSDDERRAEYDVTGKVDENVARNLLARVAKAVADMLDQALEQTNGRMSEVNLIEKMREATSKNILILKSELSKVTAQIKDLEGLRKRVKRNDDEPNLFVQIFDEKLKIAVEKRREIKDVLEVAERASEELEHYKSPVDMMRAMQGMMYAFVPQTVVSSQGGTAYSVDHV